MEEKEETTYTETQVQTIINNIANAFNQSMKENKLNKNRRNSINKRVNKLIKG